MQNGDVVLLISWFLGSFALGYTSAYLMRVFIRALNIIG